MRICILKKEYEETMPLLAGIIWEVQGEVLIDGTVMCIVTSCDNAPAELVDKQFSFPKEWFRFGEKHQIEASVEEIKQLLSETGDIVIESI